MQTAELIELVETCVKQTPPDLRPLARSVEAGDVNFDAPCEQHGWTLIQYGLEHDADQIVNAAIMYGASINAIGTGEYACTPLDLAVKKNNDKFVDLFLRHGGQGSTAATSKRMDFIALAKQTLQSLQKESKSESFVAAVAHFEDLLETKAKREKTTGFVRFKKLSLADVLKLTGTKKEQLANVVPEFTTFSRQAKAHGATLFTDAWLGYSLKKCGLLLAPTADDVALLTSLGAVRETPLAGNHQLHDSLLELNEIRSIRVLGVCNDSIVVAFDEPIEDANELADRVLEIFPFLVNFHTAGAGISAAIDVRALIAEELREDNALQIVLHTF